jgi:transposase
MRQAALHADTLTVHLQASASAAACPQCHQPAARIHSHYTRTAADLPWAGAAVRLVLHARKFFCTNAPCAQRIFAERLPTVVAPRARTTVRLQDVLRAIAFALGGEAGARLCGRLRMATSPATLLRLIRSTTPPPAAVPCVLGVDDWAKRKGVSYGTILVDLDAHRVVDLLPDRTAETLTAGLQAHPGVEILTRDRSERYATGGKAGAPDAVHVADRWHLLHNWAEALERVCKRHQAALRQVVLHIPLPPQATAATLLPAKTVNRRRPDVVARRDQTRQMQWERWTTIRERHAKGASLKDLARELRLNYKTVRKYARAPDCPYMRPYPPRRRLLTPYEPYVQARWAEGCRNGAQIYREIAAHGFRGSRVLVGIFVAHLRRNEGLSLPWLPKLARQKPVLPRDAVRLILQRPTDRSDAEETALAHIRAVHADLAEVIAFSERFAGMIRDRQVERFDGWMADAHHSSVREVRQFARNLRNDEAAVRNALRYAHSNGQVEGQVHRLKLIKRSMYGRAKFDLLRQRMLYAT